MISNSSSSPAPAPAIAGIIEELAEIEASSSLLLPATAVQLPPKYGLLEDTEMVPLKPALHVHPASTLVPLLFNGHATEEQLTNGR